MSLKRTQPALLDTAVVPTKEVAATRLQLRWAKDEQAEGLYICHYELVLALEPGDVRRERRGPRGGHRPDRANQVVSLGTTSRGADREPCYMPWKGQEMLSYDTPYRDGAHAHMDSEKLGGLPIYVVTIGGIYLRRAEVPQ